MKFDHVDEEKPVVNESTVVNDSPVANNSQNTSQSCQMFDLNLGVECSNAATLKVFHKPTKETFFACDECMDDVEDEDDYDISTLERSVNAK